MAADPNAVEQVVSRTLRDNLGKIQQTSEELNEALSDLVSACASSRAANTLPPMVRAQSSAASLAAALEVLSRFVTAALQSSLHSPSEQEVLRRTSAVAAEAAPAIEPPEPRSPQTAGESPWVAPPVIAPPEPEPEPVFDLASLPAEEQEMHRRAYRVAKVSMQDIKLLRPEDVRVGRENKDLCVRLRDDIEKAHKEYDRRFQVIQSHPVDYFYDWMVEILAGGNSEALGEYPYHSPALRH
jgi:hypothetical protein